MCPKKITRDQDRACSLAEVDATRNVEDAEDPKLWRQSRRRNPGKLCQIRHTEFGMCKGNSSRWHYNNGILQWAAFKSTDRQKWQCGIFTASLLAKPHKSTRKRLLPAVIVCATRCKAYGGSRVYNFSDLKFSTKSSLQTLGYANFCQFFVEAEALKIHTWNEKHSAARPSQQ